jgi:hypothetical protein
MDPPSTPAKKTPWTWKTSSKTAHKGTPTTIRPAHTPRTSLPPPNTQDSATSTASRTPFYLNPANLKNNHSWGPELIEEKPPDTFRLYFRNSIWAIHHNMFEYGLRNAHCFSRWKNVVNAMIEKEPGNPWIHRLRVIHLYENDYNLFIGSQYRKAVHAAEDANVLNDGNYGARTARSSLDPVGIEILQYKYSRLLCLRHLKFSNDATACYDRIVVNLASIVS